MKGVNLWISVLLFTAAGAAAQSNTCYFLVGPAAGTTRFFGQFAPIAIGALCNDGAGSSGIAVPNGLVNPVGRFSMQGDQPSCTDPLGNVVTYTFNPNIQKSGLATVVNNVPVIFLKPSDLQAYSPALQRFLYAHECGHHALGQVLAAFYYQLFLGPPYELAADCFAARSLRQQGRLSNAEFAQVMQFLAAIPGDPTTYPGPRRVEGIVSCAK